jgi:hypothetical protein
MSQSLKKEKPVSPSIDISQKNRISEKELFEKKEDGYFTFVVGPAISPDAGIGGGVIINYFHNGKKDDLLFPYTPYRHRISLLAMYQSRGYTAFDIQWDSPYFINSPFRIFTDISYNINPVEPFYGVGEKTLGRLTDPEGIEYDRIDAYESSLREINNGQTNAYYNYFYQRWFDGRLMVQRDFAGGVFRVLGGYLVKHYTIIDYSMQNIEVISPDGVTQEATMGNTALRNDFNAGKINGFSGGWNNALMASLVFDNRDFEPAAHQGMFHDITALHQTNWLGSEFEYTEITTGSRFYFSPFKIINLVIAARVAASYKFGDNIPFFGLTTMQFSNQWFNTLGDMRGYRKSRFLAPFTALANLEIRYTFLKWEWGEQLFSLSIAPFIDTASVFDSIENFNFNQDNQWKFGYGAGVRIAWNQASIIRIDFGFSEEDFGFYLLINNIY